MKILVCGGRAYNNQPVVFAALDTLHTIKPISLLINGGATGADSISSRWAHWANVEYIIYRAEWNRHGKRAGFVRNQLMLDQNLELVVAFPGGNGTYDMIGRATHKGTPIWKPLEEVCPFQRM